jgi:hypothetical protein
VKQTRVTPQFVELIPIHLEDGVLYISEIYGTAIHKCCCGCGQEVVTPLSSAQWRLRHNGDIVTLYPSIGNWNFHCRSHYWIRQNRIEWAGSMTDRQISLLQERDRHDIESLTIKSNLRKFGKATVQSNPTKKADEKPKRRLWQCLLEWLTRL